MADIHTVSTHHGEILYGLDWDIAEDTFFSGLLEAKANLLEARGVAKTWTFELRLYLIVCWGTRHSLRCKLALPWRPLTT